MKFACDANRTSTWQNTTPIRNDDKEEKSGYKRKKGSRFLRAGNVFDEVVKALNNDFDKKLEAGDFAFEFKIFMNEESKNNEQERNDYGDKGGVGKGEVPDVKNWFG